jgi:predicted transcriptional regulator
MARAPRLHRGGRGFEPLTAHLVNGRIGNGRGARARSPDPLGARAGTDEGADVADEEAPVSAEGLLGSLEYEAMTALWASAPASVPVVRSRINDRRAPGAELAYTTVMTVLVRLHEKGVLDRVHRGRGYVYTPRFDEAALVEHLSGQEVAALLDRYGAVALAHFAAEVERADPDLLRRLRRLAEPDDV